MLKKVQLHLQAFPMVLTEKHYQKQLKLLNIFSKTRKACKSQPHNAKRLLSNRIHSEIVLDVTSFTGKWHPLMRTISGRGKKMGKCFFSLYNLKLNFEITLIIQWLFPVGKQDPGSYVAQQRQLSHPISDKLQAAKKVPCQHPRWAEPLMSFMPHTDSQDTSLGTLPTRVHLSRLSQ